MQRCPYHGIPPVRNIIRTPIRLAHNVYRLIVIRGLRCPHAEERGDTIVRCSWHVVPEADQHRNEKNVRMFSRLAKLQNPFNEREQGGKARRSA